MDAELIDHIRARGEFVLEHVAGKLSDRRADRTEDVGTAEDPAGPEQVSDERRHQRGDGRVGQEADDGLADRVLDPGRTAQRGSNRGTDLVPDVFGEHRVARVPCPRRLDDAEDDLDRPHGGGAQPVLHVRIAEEGGNPGGDDRDVRRDDVMHVLRRRVALSQVVGQFENVPPVRHEPQGLQERVDGVEDLRIAEEVDRERGHRITDDVGGRSGDRSRVDQCAPDLGHQKIGEQRITDEVADRVLRRIAEHQIADELDRERDDEPLAGVGRRIVLQQVRPEEVGEYVRDAVPDRPLFQWWFGLLGQHLRFGGLFGAGLFGAGVDGFRGSGDGAAGRRLRLLGMAAPTAAGRSGRRRPGDPGRAAGKLTAADRQCRPRQRRRRRYPAVGAPVQPVQQTRVAIDD